MNYKALPIYLMNPKNSSPPLKDSLDLFNEDWLSFHSHDETLILYHYTTLDGLLGIINNRSLWCSHIRTLNDPSELQYGKKLVITQIDNYLKSINNKLIVDLLEHLKILINSFDIMFHIFVGCFCKEDNLLSQWRNYSAQGGGYSIGLNFISDTKFSHNKTALNDKSHIILRKMIYSHSIQILYINMCLENIIDGCKNSIKWFSERGGVPDNWSSKAANEAINILFDIVLSLKDSVFIEEKEWRIIKVIRDDDRPDLYKFRNSKNRLIPYLDTYIFDIISDQEVFPLTSVTYGPMVEKEMAESVLKLLLVNSSSAPNNIQFDSDSITINSAGFNLRS